MKHNDDVLRLAAELSKLMAQVEETRLTLLGAVYGLIAEDRLGRKFVIHHVKVVQGSRNVFVQGAVLKKDGTPHACNTVLSGIVSLRSLKWPVAA